jgi:hypothetical protein
VKGYFHARFLGGASRLTAGAYPVRMEYGMSTFEEFCESVGVPVRRGAAACAYRPAQDIDDIHFAAGEHLALHAVGIMQTLVLPRRGSLVLKAMRRLFRTKWLEYWRMNNQAFCACAILDLCKARQFLREANRWAEFAPLLKQSFILACIYFGQTINMAEEEKEMLHQEGTKHIIDFEDRPERTAKDQLDRIMEIEGLRKERIRKAQFIKQAIVSESYLEPFFLLQEFDRVKRARPAQPPNEDQRGTRS